MLQGRRPQFVSLLKLLEIVKLLPPPEVLIHSLKKLKTTQAISFDVCEVGMGKNGEWASD